MPEAQPGQEQRMEREEFAACPLCKQYSHSIGDDQLATAFAHFKSMYSHRGDGIPTQNCFDEQTRDAAQVLMAAATRPTADLGEDGEIERIARAIATDLALQDGNEWTPPEDWDYRFTYLDQGEVDFKQVARAVLRSGG